MGQKEGQGQPENTINLLFVFELIKQYLWYIIGVVGIACLMAVILTMPYFYPPEYKASTIIYPTSPERFDLDNVFSEDPNVYVFGDSKGVEKLDNIANSEELKMFVIDSLNLWGAYGIDPERSGSPKYYVLRNYNGNVQTLRVSGSGLEITAFDRDPQKAADIVNLVVERVDFTMRRMLQQNKSSILAAYREGEKQLGEQLEQVADSILRLREKYNVFHGERQTDAMVSQFLSIQRELAEALAQASYYRTRNASRYREYQNKAIGLEHQIQSMAEGPQNEGITLKKFREGYDRVRQMEMLQDELAMEWKNVKKKIINLGRMKEIPFHTILITERAYPADRKARPVRWVILVAVGFLSTLAAIAGVVLVDRLLPEKE